MKIQAIGVLSLSVVLAAACSKQGGGADPGNAPAAEAPPSQPPAVPAPPSASRHHAKHSWSANCVDASGPSVTQNRSVGSFRGVEVRGSADVSFYQGSPRPVRVEGPKAALDQLVTEVVNGRLVIRTEGCVRSSTPVRVHAWAAKPNEARISGSGDITGETAMKGDSFKIHVAGSGDVKLSLDVAQLETHIAGSGNVVLTGRADKQSVSIAGSGDLRGAKLVTSDTSARVVGSGDAKVNATRSLQATVIGSGDLRYRGGATVRSRIIGSGSIEKL